MDRLMQDHAHSLAMFLLHDYYGNDYAEKLAELNKELAASFNINGEDYAG